MIHLVTFASGDMQRSQEVCEESALAHGVSVSHHYREYSLESFPDQDLIAQPRGVGFWSWKPYLILGTMNLPVVSNGDILIYSDAGVEFINDVGHILNYMDDDIFLFGNNWEHAHWCKRDVIEEVWNLLLDGTSWPYGDHQHLPAGRWCGPDPILDAGSKIAWETFGKQVQASVIFFRVSDYTRKFVKEWLDWCLFEGGRLIDDSPSRSPNHVEFQENRHDQAILTTMAYREGIKLHWWPAIYNDGQFTYEKLPIYAGDDYPAIFHHHRRRNHEWSNAA